MNDLLQIVLPFYFVVFFAMAVVGRSYLVWKQTGINPYVLKEADGAEGFIGFVFRMTFILIFLTIIFFSFIPPVYEFTGRFVWLENFWVAAAGLFLLAVALIWILIAQNQMGRSWRVGIDKKNKTDLVEQGLFRVSRNPIFFGMRLSLLGFFLTLPNALTLLALGLGDCLIQIQVRLEEEHLIDLHGEKYVEYRKRVRRWI